MKRFVADRINIVEGSKSVGLASIVSNLRAQGEKIISMSIGEPDFDTDLDIIEATAKALYAQKTKYSLVEGEKSFREAIMAKVKRDNDIDCKLDEILVSNGSKQTLYNIFQTVINPGDEVIIPVPYWVSFPESVKLAGGVPLFIKTNNHQLDLELLEKIITKIINSPNNPTGAVYSKKSLEALGEIVLKHNLLLISDEAYEGIVFDGQKNYSPASFSKELFDHTLTVQSMSKTYCMTGFRVGYLIANRDIICAMNKLQSHLNGNVTPFVQHGAEAALRCVPPKQIALTEIFQKRRDIALKKCLEIFPCVAPGGAFYLYPNVKKHLGSRFKTSEDLAKFILQEAKVAILPSEYFGDTDHLRFSFAASESDIIEAFSRIGKILA